MLDLVVFQKKSSQLLLAAAEGSLVLAAYQRRRTKDVAAKLKTLHPLRPVPCSLLGPLRRWVPSDPGFPDMGTPEREHLRLATRFRA
jgi:hypothetical protein